MSPPLPETSTPWSEEEARRLVRAILYNPATNLATISAKRVRKELSEKYHRELWVQEHRDEIGALISDVFQEVSAVRGIPGQPEGASLPLPPAPAENSTPTAESASAGAGAEDDEAGNDEQEEDGEDDKYEEDEIEKERPRKKLKKGSMTDEELARQLSAELNGRPRTTRGATTTTAKSPIVVGGSRRKARRGVKSAAHVDSDLSDVDTRKKSSKRKAGSGGAKGGFAKEYALRYVHMRFRHSNSLSYIIHYRPLILYSVSHCPSW
jgi:upstream activation factor subunit UAF30